MPEHYPKSCVSASVWCNRCNKTTQHRVDNGRRGPCLECMAREEAEVKAQKEKPAPAEQLGLLP